jgi:hypothetical protein
MRTFFQFSTGPLNPRYNSVHGREESVSIVPGTDTTHPKATPFFCPGGTRAMGSAGSTKSLGGLFAQMRFDPEMTILGLLLFVLVVAGGIAVIRVRRWRSERATPAPLTDLVRNLQALVERGELDPKEFERIKARLEQMAAEPPPPP